VVNEREVKAGKNRRVALAFQQEFKGFLNQFLGSDLASGYFVIVIRLEGYGVGGGGLLVYRNDEGSRVFSGYLDECCHPSQLIASRRIFFTLVFTFYFECDSRSP
jgi:hypothetical protein